LRVLPLERLPLGSLALFHEAPGNDAKLLAVDQRLSARSQRRRKERGDQVTDDGILLIMSVRARTDLALVFATVAVNNIIVQG
jgi:hypothetical protein